MYAQVTHKGSHRISSDANFHLRCYPFSKARQGEPPRTAPAGRCSIRKIPDMKTKCRPISLRSAHSLPTRLLTCPNVRSSWTVIALASPGRTERNDDRPGWVSIPYLAPGGPRLDSIGQAADSVVEFRNRTMSCMHGRIALYIHTRG